MASGHPGDGGQDVAQILQRAQRQPAVPLVCMPLVLHLPPPAVPARASDTLVTAARDSVQLAGGCLQAGLQPAFRRKNASEGLHGSHF